MRKARFVLEDQKQLLCGLPQQVVDPFLVLECSSSLQLGPAQYRSLLSL